MEGYNLYAKRLAVTKVVSGFNNGTSGFQGNIRHPF